MTHATAQASIILSETSQAQRAQRPQTLLTEVGGLVGPSDRRRRVGPGRVEG